MKCPNCAQDELIRVKLVDSEDGLVHQESDWCPSCDCLQEIGD
ncbi:zinc finger protein [Caudoviricetes sp.]|nr:zinc finger protein [Caudoviricetes sp.]